LLFGKRHRRATIWVQEGGEEAGGGAASLVIFKGAGFTFHWAASLPALLQFLYHAIQIRIPGPEAPRKPIPPALRDLLAIRHHIELTRLARHKHHIHMQLTLDEVHETRDLYLVVLSRRAVNDLDLHLFPNPLRIATAILSDG
jgi:hypothetical protein